VCLTKFVTVFQFHQKDSFPVPTAVIAAPGFVEKAADATPHCSGGATDAAATAVDARDRTVANIVLALGKL
jgi:hypothetical protein